MDADRQAEKARERDREIERRRLALAMMKAAAEKDSRIGFDPLGPFRADPPPPVPPIWGTRG